MKVDYSKEFEKSLKKLSGKMLDSIRRVITEVKQAENIKDITDCTKLVGYSNIVRIRFHFLSFIEPTLKSANSTSKCKITKCFCKSTPLVLRNSISFLVSH